LSNKPKVIALLLSFSLLSGCNKTAGGGIQETTMQGNDEPPSNTTSVPSTEAGNSPPATGDAVRVARWAKNPNWGSQLAPNIGQLSIANNCLVISKQDAPPTLLIFPYGSGVWDGTKQTFTFEGKVIRIGESIAVYGGPIDNLDALVRGDVKKYDVPDCGTTDFYVVY
jgi:hypothetical protein